MLEVVIWKLEMYRCVFIMRNESIDTRKCILIRKIQSWVKSEFNVHKIVKIDKKTKELVNGFQKYCHARGMEY